jgi:hypothetical protein
MLDDGRREENVQKWRYEVDIRSSPLSFRAAAVGLGS